MKRKERKSHYFKYPSARPDYICFQQRNDIAFIERKKENSMTKE